MQVAVADFAMYLLGNPGARQSWTTREKIVEENRAKIVEGFESGFRKAVLTRLQELDGMSTD